MALSTTVGLEFIARDRSRYGMRSFESNMRRTQRTVTSFSRSILGLIGVGGGMYMLNSFMRSSVQEFVSYEKQLAKISTMLDNMSMRYMPAYANELRKMSVTYGESMESLTTGLYDLLSAEIEASKAMKVLETTVRSAKGGFTTANITTQATIRILEGYNLEAKEAARINDVLHATVRKGVMDFEGLSASIGNVVGPAALLDIEIEALGATLATLSKTLTIDKAVMSLKNMLMTFKNPTAEARLAAKNLGFELDETSLKGKGLITIFEKLNKANAQQLEALMPNLRGFIGLATAFENVGAASANYEFITNSTRLAEENFAKAMDTTSAKLAILEQRFNSAKITMGEWAVATYNKAAEEFESALVSVTKNVFGLRGQMLHDFMGTYQPLLGILGGRAFDKGEMQPLSARSKPQFDSLAIDRASLGMQKLAADTDSAKRSWAEVWAGAEPRNLKLLDTEQSKAFLETTRQHIDAVRHMDHLTRIERIANLQKYVDANKYKLKEVAAAERALHDEILTLQRSRMNAMVNYTAEMKERTQEPYLAMMDHAEAFMRTTEGMFATMWDPFIDKTKSAGEVVSDFFKDFFLNLAKARMQASMMRVWDAAAGPGIAALVTGLFTPVGAKVNAATPGAGGVHGFRAGGLVKPLYAAGGLGGPRGTDTVPAWLTPGEWVLPKSTVDGIKRGRGGGERPINLTLNLNAIDNQTGISFIHGKIPQIVAELRAEMRGNDQMRRDDL